MVNSYQCTGLVPCEEYLQRSRWSLGSLAIAVLRGQLRQPVRELQCDQSILHPDDPDRVQVLDDPVWLGGFDLFGGMTGPSVSTQIDFQFLFNTRRGGTYLVTSPNTLHPAALPALIPAGESSSTSTFAFSLAPAKPIRSRPSK